MNAGNLGGGSLDLQIIGAAYGLADVTTTVIDRVNRGTSPQSLSIAASNSVFGDRWPDKRKSLTVVYRYGDTGNAQVATATEGQTLTIAGTHEQSATPFDATSPAPQLTIFGATYGPVDKTAIVRSHVDPSSQSLSVTANNDTFTDTWPNVTKTLVVVAAYTGQEPFVDVVPEGSAYFLKYRPPLRILSATYGLASVTRVVQGSVSRRTLTINANNSVLGDGWRDVTKTLVVVYQYGDEQPQIAIVTEGSTLSVDYQPKPHYEPPSDPLTLNVIRAAYGRADVTATIAGKVANNALDIVADNALFGDTWPNVRKSFDLTYSWGPGSPARLAAPEGSTIKLPTPWTPTSALAHAVYAAGFLYDPRQDIIYSRMDALQRNLGYAYGYDAAALGISAVLDCEPIFFDYDGKHWMIELWKGQYGLESGCEIGVYTRPIGSTGPGYALLDATVGRRGGDPVPSHNLFYDCAADADRLKLSATLHRDGEVLFTRGPEVHWWLTGFKWGVLSDPSQLSADIAITLKDNQMRDAFMKGIAGRPYPNLKVDGTTVSFTFARPYAVPQPPKPGLAAVEAANREIVSTYQALGFPNNDPNDVQAEFLSVAGLGLLHLADYVGLAVCQLAVGIGEGMSSVVTALVDGFSVAASTVEGWLSDASQAFATWVNAIENYLGLPLDFSCCVEIDNTKGTSDLVLTGHTATYGTYVVGPPSWIPKGTVARLVLQDPKPSGHGSEGTVTYNYSDTELTMRTVTFSYECPTGFLPNKAASSQADWACFAKSSNPNAPWSLSVPPGGHPLFVGYVTGGGQPS